MLELWLTPWRAGLSMTAATLETLIATQKSMSVMAPKGMATPMTEDKLGRHCRCPAESAKLVA